MKFGSCIIRVIPQSSSFRGYNVSEPRLMLQCVSAVRVVEVPVFVCLHSICNHMTEVGALYDL
jgi:hypothetical protein